MTNLFTTESPLSKLLILSLYQFDFSSPSNFGEGSWVPYSLSSCVTKHAGSLPFFSLFSDGRNNASVLQECDEAQFTPAVTHAQVFYRPSAIPTIPGLRRPGPAQGSLSLGRLCPADPCCSARASASGAAAPRAVRLGLCESWQLPHPAGTKSGSESQSALRQGPAVASRRAEVGEPCGLESAASPFSLHVPGVLLF